MKKEKVINYEKPNYSTLKMITGKMLPAGLVFATIITSIPNSDVLANKTANADHSQNETEDFSIMVGELPAPKIVTEDFSTIEGKLPVPKIVTEDFSAIAGDLPIPTVITEKKPITVLVNQAIMEFDVAPILENGTVLVPLRKILETLGASVTWDDETKTATAIKGNDTIVLAVNDTKMLKNGVEVTLDTATKIVDNRLLVPISVLSEGIGCNVAWNESDNKVTIECQEEKDIIVLPGYVSVVDNKN